MASVFYLNKEGLEENVQSLLTGRDSVLDAIESIRTAANQMPDNFKGATADQFQEKLDTMLNDQKKVVEDSMEAMTQFVTQFTNSIIDGDEEGAAALLGK